MIITSSSWLLARKLDSHLNCVASKFSSTIQRKWEALNRKKLVRLIAHWGLESILLKIKRLISTYWNPRSAEEFLLGRGNLRGNLGKFKFALMRVRSHSCLSVFLELLESYCHSSFTNFVTILFIGLYFTSFLTHGFCQQHSHLWDSFTLWLSRYKTLLVAFLFSLSPPFLYLF